MYIGQLEHVHCKELHGDNGTNFVGVRQLRQMFKPRSHHYLKNRKVTICVDYFEFYYFSLRHLQLWRYSELWDTLCQVSGITYLLTIRDTLFKMADEDYANCNTIGIERCRVTQKRVTDFKNLNVHL